VLFPLSRPTSWLTRRNLALGLLLGLTFAVYLRATRNEFVNYDDQGYIVENQHVQQGLNAATLRWALTSTEESNWHPLTWLSHALDCQLFGLNPAGHHFTNVLLHVLNVGLLFWLLWRATGAIGRSFMVAALFALHPLNVESVAWVAERKNVLCMFFFLLTLGAYGWYARRPGWKRYLAVAGLFVLALAAKPMAVTLPCVLLLVDFWPLRRVQSREAPSEKFPVPQQPLGRLVLEKLPLLVLSVASSVITVLAQRSAEPDRQLLPITLRAGNALHAYLMYILKGFWPTRLAAHYPYQGYGLSVWSVLLSCVFLVTVTAWVLRERSRPYLPVGWFWFLGTLVPMIGLVQVGDQDMADRYAYLPLVGIFVMVVWGVAGWARTRRVKLQWCVMTSAVILAALTVLTWRQIGTWRNSRALWEHALRVTKNNYMAEDYIGVDLLFQNYETSGQRYSSEALVHFQNAVRINPRDPISHINLGADLQEHGKFQEAIEQYQTVLKLTQKRDLIMKTWIDMGAAYQQMGDLPTARRFYLQVLKMDPGNQVAFTNLGRLGMEERIQQLAASASTHPSPEAYLQLGKVQQIAGRVADARASYQTALKLDPKFSEARNALNSLADGVTQ